MPKFETLIYNFIVGMGIKDINVIGYVYLRSHATVYSYYTILNVTQTMNNYL